MDGLVADRLAEHVRKRPELDILSIFPKDTTTYCRCDKCARLAPSTAWYEFYNRLTDALKQEFPGLRFGTIAYFEYRAVPQCQIRNTEFVEYCSYSRCNVHPYGQPGCKRNEETMRDMLAWQATGLPIGNYAYEFDVFRRNHRFTPFLSMIDDAIKMGRKLGHVTMIPEVLLIARKHVAAEEYIFNVQQRLPIYLYARLLWDPDQDMTDNLRDWCRTVFGEAADPMLDYYLSMDRAWSAMPNHLTILGDALNIAPHLLSDTLRQEAAAAFAAAEQRLPTLPAGAARERAAAAIVRERVLFRQWQELAQASDVTAPRLSLPLLAQAEDFAQTASRQQQVGVAQVRLAWTREALLVRWVSPYPAGGAREGEAVDRDADAGGDESVELILSSGLTGETWHFAVNPRGTRQDWRDTNTGVRDDRWAPAWQAKTALATDRWQAEMTIPFAALGQAPNPNESWQVKFVRHHGGRTDVAPAAFPAEGMALLLFSAAARTDRALLWWSGAPERESKFDARLTQEFTQAGWQMNLVSTPEGLSALDGTCDVYWFKHPNGPNKPPAEFWDQHLVAAVRNGALAVFDSYWDMPVDQYFQDPSMKVKTVGIGKLPLAARRAKFVAPGEWSSTPHALERALKNGITPAYVLVPEDAATWTILASAPRNETVSRPYLMVRPFGKGLIVICSGPIARVSNTALLDNLLLYHEKLITADPD